MNKEYFRILSLDGGGIRGLFSAAFLSHIEQYSGERLVDHFDLIVGTSTGAIIALGLAAGMPAAEILRFYQDEGPRIFTRPASLLRWIFRPRYNNGRLIGALRQVLGEKTLNELEAPVAIPSYDLSTGCNRVFKDDHDDHLHWGGNWAAWKVAAASSAAPLFFPAFQLDAAEGDSHTDGGVWANNPVLVGITEAMRYFHQELPNISVLSVGTGDRKFRISHQEAAFMGVWGWVHLPPRIIDVQMDAQSKAAHHTAHLLLGPDRYLRINTTLDRPIGLDNYEQAKGMISLGNQEGRLYLREVEHRFFDRPRTTLAGPREVERRGGAAEAFSRAR